MYLEIGGISSKKNNIPVVVPLWCWGSFEYYDLDNLLIETIHINLARQIIVSSGMTSSRMTMATEFVTHPCINQQSSGGGLIH